MSPAFTQSQRGAALIISLILLVALSLLGLASMNTSSLDLIMAGNEQYRNRAFQAAETAIEAAMASDANNFNSNTPFNSAVVTYNDGHESYQFTITPRPGGPVAPPIGTSATQGSVNGYAMQIYSVAVIGRSDRGTQVTRTQGLYEITPAPQSQAAKDTLGGQPTSGTSLNGTTVTAIAALP